MAIFLALPSLVLAQDYSEKFYQAYIREDMSRWEEYMDEMEAAWRIERSDELLLDLVEAEYGYTAWLLTSKKNKKEAGAYIDKAMGQMDDMIARGNANARLYSMQGAFYGYMTMIEMRKAPTYGKLSLESNDRAFELDSKEPRAWLEKGNMKYYMPRLFGGSKKEAALHYKKAVELFEDNAEQCKRNWMYLNAMAGWAMACEKTGKVSEAGSIYRKILRTEPRFKWVAEDLYPSFQEKHPGK